MNFVDVFIIFVITLILIMFIQNHYGEVEYVVSTIDKKNYLVRKLQDKQAAADYLADINKRLTRLVRHMVAKHGQNAEVLQLYKNYNPDAVSEGSIESGYTSYSVNKGEKLILCIRQKDKSFVEKNVVMYVAIHELSHIMTKEIGHTDTFWANFKFLLEEAIDIGLYSKKDFNREPADYCGIKITNSIV
jgi:predicted metal-dependent hydrolase